MTDRGIIDINQISIENCLRCILPDCISTNLELCPLLKREIRLKREEHKTRKIVEENNTLKGIDDILGSSGLTMVEIGEELGYTYGYLNSLLRRDKLKGKRVKLKGKRVKVVIVGVNL